MVSLETRAFPESLQPSFYEVFLSSELGKQQQWFRGDLLFLENAGKQTLVILVDWIQNYPNDMIVVSQQVCNNIQCFYQDIVQVTRLSHELFPLERTKFLPLQSVASDRPSTEILIDLQNYFSNNTWHPVTTGDIIPVQTEHGLLEIKLVESSPREHGCLFYGRTIIEVSDSRKVKHSVKNARFRSLTRAQ